MPKEKISWVYLGKTFNAFLEKGRELILQPASPGDWPFEQQNGHHLQTSRLGRK